MQWRVGELVARALKGGLLACAATLSGCVLASPARTSPLTAPPELAMETVSFASRSGSNIRGWYLRGVPGEGAVLLLHGVGDNRTSMVARARFLHGAGYTVLLPDFQAHGESTGEFITFGALESLDAEAALTFLRGRSGEQHIGVIGISMGGAAALLGPGPLKADAFVLESVYPTIRQAVEDRLAVWLGPLAPLNKLIAPLVILGVSTETGVNENALRPIDRIARAEAPVLVLTGSLDTYTPLAEARALFGQARAPKEFCALEGAGHEDLHLFDTRRYERVVGDFLAKYLRGGAAELYPRPL
jgi:fermentation-respiration switch protein FrsA (DUF1100 family)